MAELDDYILDVLMRDLVGHDKSPSAFLVYLHIWHKANGTSAALSHQKIAEQTGLSKSAVQNAIKLLTRRSLITTTKPTITATPEYKPQTPWRRS